MITQKRIRELVAEHGNRAGAGPRRGLTPDAIKKGPAAAAVAVRERARTFYIGAGILPPVKELRAAGLTLRQIAAALNDEGHRTRHGRPWNAAQVMRVLNLADTPPTAPPTAA